MRSSGSRRSSRTRTPTVKDNPNVQMAEYPDNGYFYIGFNLREGHLYADKAAS